MSVAPLCVRCRERPSVDHFRPFCSARCQMADLGKWLTGEYRVAVREDDAPETDVLATGADDQDRNE